MTRLIAGVISGVATGVVSQAACWKFPSKRNKIAGQFSMKVLHEGILPPFIKAKPDLFLRYYLGVPVALTNRCCQPFPISYVLGSLDLASYAKSSEIRHETTTELNR
ncbi:hypothetical protein AVEN_146070-1 [Araneus ventricosus]|uniref:Uncharacterized protein n=1 Tax=Araneus ventricosus TaxID=182803 RepID=A0A4Y2LDY2_ARAVE|nr:hypothetical protein AVEN_146070-1 [Araneus ventricosus]